MLSINGVSSASLEHFAGQLLRLSMVVIFLWFGLQKFTEYEAIGIAPLVSNSPLTSWLNVLGTQGASMIIGASELLFGLLLATGFRWPGSVAAILGALGACVTFLTTLSFMESTPGVWAPSGPPLLSGTIGGVPHQGHRPARRVDPPAGAKFGAQAGGGRPRPGRPERFTGPIRACLRRTRPDCRGTR